MRATRTTRNNTDPTDTDADRTRHDTGFAHRPSARQIVEPTRAVPSAAVGLRGFAARRPVVTSVGLLIVNATTIALGGALTAALAPGWSGTARSLAAMAGPVIMTVLAVALLTSPRDAGLTPPQTWRQPWLLAVPAALCLVPLAGGLRSVASGLLAILLVGYLLTGIVEELLWRGVVLRVLLPIGPTAAALVGSALFGAAHLTNVLFRDSVALVGAQAFGAACFGVGYAALRLRTGTVWPLMALHAATDLFAAIGGLPKIPVLVGQDVVLLIFGLVLLARWHGQPAGKPRAATRI